MRTRRVLGGSLMAVALVAASNLGAGALTGTFTEVEPAIPDGFLSGDAINDAGQSTGTADFGAGTRGFVRDADGTFTELALLGGASYSQGRAINESGDVVGGSGSIAVLWESGAGPVDLGTLPGDTESFARDINDDGWIVGTSNGPGGGRSWARDPDVGTLVDLGNVLGGSNVQVRAINNDEIVVGRVLVAGEWQPFTWTEGDGIVLLPVPAGEVDFEPIDSNEAGQFVGFSSEFVAPEVIYRAYLFDPVDGYVPLTMEGYESTFPHGMNDDGLVVGFVDNTGSSSRVPAAWHTGVDDAAAFPLFSDTAFTNELNAVNNSGTAIGITREGDDFDRTWIGPISIEGPPVAPTAPTAPPAQPAAAAPTFTG